MSRAPTRAVLAAALANLLLMAACGGNPGSAVAAGGDLEVFAAASLSESFTAAAAGFEKDHAGVRVRLNFAGTPTLLAQMTQGASADVFASADQANMDRAIAARLVTGPGRTFATNRLEIVVRPGNPRHVAGLADLARPDVLFITEAPSVPAGRYAAQALAAAGVRAGPRSEEADVKSVVGKVALGEADAGIVYVTDVRAAGPRVSGVPIPDSQNVIARYPVAVAQGARNPAAAREFVAYLLSPAGQALLERFGFGGA